MSWLMSLLVLKQPIVEKPQVAVQNNAQVQEELHGLGGPTLDWTPVGFASWVGLTHGLRVGEVWKV